MVRNTSNDFELPVWTWVWLNTIYHWCEGAKVTWVPAWVLWCLRLWRCQTCGFRPITEKDDCDLCAHHRTLRASLRSIAFRRQSKKEPTDEDISSWEGEGGQ